MKRHARRSLMLALALLLAPAASTPAQIQFDLGTAVLTIERQGQLSSLVLQDGSAWPVDARPLFVLETEQRQQVPVAVDLQGDRLQVEFQGGATATFMVRTEPGLMVWELTELQGAEPGVEKLQLFHLAVPPQADLAAALNACSTTDWSVAVMGAEPNVLGQPERLVGAHGDRPGCSHQFEQVTGLAQVGQYAARFTATCNEQPGGWSVRGKRFAAPLDLTGCRAIRAWVHGDGKGEQLKIQLHDGAGGYRDNYLPIDFQGWRQVTLVDSPINTLRYDTVNALNIYYNGMPADTTVTCHVDHIEAVVERDGREQVIVLEDFESPSAAWWSPPGTVLSVSTTHRHGLTPARFAVVVSPRAELWDYVARCEQAAGMPSPRPGGVWNKHSPWIHRSYYFLTAFRESQFDEALAIARRGGFHTILIDQGSWCRGTGHFEVNRDNFPDGLDGLAHTMERFREAGFRVGLHFLAASIYPPDPYLTPVPDPRLVKGPAVALASDVDAAADFLPTAEAPADFPAEDGGYEGAGTVLQIGQELVQYSERSLTPPYGFRGCRRGHLRTQAAPHQAGDSVTHLVRAYGYHMFDMDTTLLDEVATHFARVANACKVDMLYFDGSERLQGDHWYYNAKLHKAYYDKLENKDVLLQASSFSHYSWHLLARSASADGHGDLKGYLDERSPWFTSFSATGMPLDIGWYYGYDPTATPDMFEYVLGTTIGYDASMSFQVSVNAARQHPFTGEILDLIRRYEQLRLSGRVDAAMKERLRIDPQLGGKQDPAERAQRLDLRREYRLLEDDGNEFFQRVVYTPWHTLMSAEPAENSWPVRVAAGPVRAGVQLHALGGVWLTPGPSYMSDDAIVLETFDDLAPYAGQPTASVPVREIGPGQAGSVLPGVTQRLELRSDDGRAGPHYAVYTAESTLATADGWSAIGKRFDPPLDLSAHQGIGFWMRGDGQGGAFKLQLRDSRGATDYYITNDFEGWRYQQLPRPTPDPIDYSQVTSLTLYYNGLPARTTAACAIDDIKALPTLDERALVDPVIEVAGQRFAWQGTLREGQYLTLWPGEPALLNAPGQSAPERSDHPVPEWTLPAGEFTARLLCRPPHNMPVRARLTLQPPERHEISPAEPGS